MVRSLVEKGILPGLLLLHAVGLSTHPFYKIICGSCWVHQIWRRQGHYVGSGTQEKDSRKSKDDEYINIIADDRT